MPQRVAIFDGCMDWEETAEKIARPVSSLKCYHSDWGIPHVRICGRIWFLEAEVDDWLRKEAVAHRKTEGQAEAMWHAMNERRAAK